MDNIVVLIGSFNPITKAHFEALHTAKKYLNATKAIFVPTPEAYVKGKMTKVKERLAFSNDFRVKLIDSVCKKNEGFEISDFEMKANTTYKTYETMKHIKNNNPNSEVYYIMGADKLMDICGWENIILFFEEFKFLVYKRSDIDIDKIIESRPLLQEYKDRFVYLEALENLGDVSSTKVRRLINNNDLSYKEYVDEDVFNILKNINLEDYPIVTDYDLISFYLNSGKSGKAYEIVYKLNKELFKNLDLTNQLDNSRIIDDVSLTSNPLECEAEVEITRTDIYSILKANPNSLLLVEGNKGIPAGGSNKGNSKSLEEKLCFYTTLSPSLYRFGNNRMKAVKESGYFKEKVYPLSDYRMVFTPNIKIIRDKKTCLELENFNDEFDALVIPSISLGRIDKYNDIDKYGSGDSLNEDGIKALIKRLEQGFIFAANQKYDNVVINVFGTGFYIPFNDSAYVLKEVINKYKKFFKKIIINTSKTNMLKEAMK